MALDSLSVIVDPELQLTKSYNYPEHSTYVYLKRGSYPRFNFARSVPWAYIAFFRHLVFYITTLVYVLDDTLGRNTLNPKPLLSQKENL